MCCLGFKLQRWLVAALLGDFENLGCVSRAGRRLQELQACAII